MASSDVLMRVTWRDTAVFGVGFSLGALVTECLVFLCARCRKKRKRNQRDDNRSDADSNEEETTKDMLKPGTML